MIPLRMMVVVGLFVPLLATASSLTDAVIQSKHYDDIVDNLKRHQCQIQTPEQIPDELFDTILNNKATNADWRALQHYRHIVDAGASLEFMHSCFKALKKEPLLFYKRYMSGDHSALQRMRDAFSYDFSAYSRSTGEDYESVEKFYENVIATINERRNHIARNSLKEHDKFVLVIRRQFANWQSRYAGKAKQN